MRDNILASSLQQPHITVFDKAFKDALANMDLSPAMLYIIDTCPAAALPALAEQFDVTGYKGWLFANTDAKKRALIKNAILMHQKKGTPFAVKNAMRVIGFENTQVKEQLIGAKYNGQYNYNGSINYNAPGPFHFRVVIDAGAYGIVDVITIQDLVKLIYEYKNERSWLYDLSFGYTFRDMVNMLDEGIYLLDEDGITPVLDEDGNFIYVEPNLFKMTIKLNLRDGFNHTYDGTYNYDGAITYNADYGEDLQVTEI